MDQNENKDYINFGDFCRRELGIQSQYGYYSFKGLAGRPKLGEGLRVIAPNGRESDYHTLLIHKDDAETFKERMKKHELCDYEY